MSKNNRSRKSQPVTHSTRTERQTEIAIDSGQRDYNNEKLRRASQHSLKELRYSLLVTLLTLAVMAVLVYFRPAMTAYLTGEHTGLDHPRIFQKTPKGGVIWYLDASPESRRDAEEIKVGRETGLVRSAGAGAASEQAGQYEQDLKILAHRFERGQFEMATMLNSRIAPEVRGMREHSREFHYATERLPHGADLRITADNAAAAGALHAYLDFLAQGWVLR